MSHKSCEARMTAIALEVAERLRRLAEPIPAGDRVKTQIARAARRAGLPYGRTRDLWYQRTRRIDGCELDAIRHAESARLQESSDDLVRLAADCEALARRLSDLVAPSGREEAEYLRGLARRARHLAQGG